MLCNKLRIVSHVGLPVYRESCRFTVLPSLTGPDVRSFFSFFFADSVNDKTQIAKLDII